MQFEFFCAFGDCINFYQKNLFKKITYRAGFLNILRKINLSLLRKVDLFESDVIVVPKGVQILPKTVIKLKDRGIKLVNCNLDHPFEHSTKGAGKSNVIDGIKYFVLHITYFKEIKRELESKLKVYCEWLLFGYSFSKEQVIEDFQKNRVCFTRVPDIFRAIMVSELLRSKIEVECVWK